MSKRQDIINQIFFILIILFIIFLLWGYGAGWLGASADVNSPGPGKGNFMTGVVNGIEKLRNLPYFVDERSLNTAL
jgi:hypothetical protein